MTVTNEERRAVAQRIHEMAPGTLARCFGFDGEPSFSAFRDRLEDLIRPSDDAVDVDTLLALADELHAMGKQFDEVGRYGLGYTFKAVADKIREACGAMDG